MLSVIFSPQILSLLSEFNFVDDVTTQDYQSFFSQIAFSGIGVVVF